MPLIQECDYPHCTNSVIVHRGFFGEVQIPKFWRKIKIEIMSSPHGAAHQFPVLCPLHADYSIAELEEVFKIK